MKISETAIDGVKIIEPRVFGDERGYFVETYESKRYADVTGSELSFVQDNISRSKAGVLRGLHFQKGEHAQGKLVSVMAGKVFDVALDVRKDSPTYGKHVSIELGPPVRQDDGTWTWKQFYVPPGLAHGFLTLEDDTIFAYKCTNFYEPGSDAGVIWNDPSIAIDWPEIDAEICVSEKDQKLPTLANLYT